MVMRGRAFFLPTASLACVVGCTQILGLGDYREAPEGGFDEAGGIGSDGNGDGPTGASFSDLGSASSLDVGEGPFDATFESMDDSAGEATNSAADAGYLDAPYLDATYWNDSSTEDADALPVYDAPADGPAEDNVTDATPADVLSEGSRDAQSVDATNDVVVACPAECNAGCGPTGTTCAIAITSMTSAPVVCPPGFACQVQCLGAQVCNGTIDCAAGQPCHVVCSGMDACNSATINQGAATSLCVECLHMQSTPGCNAVTCTGVCSIVCSGPGCNSSCAICTTVPACP
jgi:hypothetical protein